MISYFKHWMKLEDFAPLLILQTHRNICRDASEIKGTLRFQAVLVPIQPASSIELIHIYEVYGLLLFKLGL